MLQPLPQAEHFGAVDATPRHPDAISGPGSDDAFQVNILRTLADSVPHHIYAKDAQGRFIFANQAVASGMGVGAPQALIGKTDFDFYPEASAAQYFDEEQQIITSGQPLLNHEENLAYLLMNQDAWMLTSKVPLRDPQGRVVGLVGINYDITERKAMERSLATAKVAAETAHDRLLESEDRYRHLVEELPDGLIVECAGRIVFANPAALSMYAAEAMSELMSRSLPSLFAAPAAGDLDPAAPWSPQPIGGANTEEEALKLDGTRLPVAVSRLAIQWDGMPALQLVMRDISVRRLLEQNLQHLATHDALTGLPNRALLTERIDLAIVDSVRREETFQLCFIDLDRFKWVNDSVGHDAGDELLKVMGNRLASVLRASDTAARLGGDEFVVLLRHAANERDVVHVTDRIAKSLAQPVRIGRETLTVTCSIGCSQFPQDGDTADELMKCADAAMYRAKALGRNQVQVYNTELRERIDRRLHLESELRCALDRGQFTLHYQPQVNLKTGRIDAVEALLRWNHPELGNVFPDRFIPIAEETGLIIPIGEWVVRTACAQMVAWQRAGIAPDRMAVNISAKQFAKDDLAATLHRLVADSGMDPSRLDVELTESASMEAPERARSTMLELKALGVCLSIDDFGSGYSNMGYLRRFPVDQLKLDGMLTSEICSDAGALAIVESVVTLSHRLGLVVIAEKVETAEQLALLRACGCDYAQGYFFSKPVPAAMCAKLFV